jgi:hypothetical protein
VTVRTILTLLAILSLVAAACAAPQGAQPAIPPEETTETQPSDQAEAGTLPEGPSALREQTSPEFPEPLVDPGQIISGGPPPDGIPPIDEPAFVPISEADKYLDSEEPIVVLEVGEEARAYPVQILTWHEIVNDTVGGKPVVVTYCPLCNTAVSFVRVVNGVETTFGTSGRLYNSALVMYDRATESLWTHFDGRAVVGVLAGEQLEPVPSPLLAWSELKSAHPEAQVLDRERTGANRPYGTNPYAGYDNPEGFPFLFRGDVDARAQAMQRVVGVALSGEATAFTLEAVSGGEGKATNGEVGGQPIVILWKSGQASALEENEVAEGRDVGSVGVFLPEADGRRLTFQTEAGQFVDQETGSTWNIAGQATEGPLAGRALERIHHFDTFWFAWSSYQPGTALVEG